MGSKISDPRPIGDKKYTSAMVKSLLNFLLASKYDSAITAKQLHSPSKGDFMKVFQFLLRTLDPALVLATGSDDEVREILKMLQYVDALHARAFDHSAHSARPLTICWARPASSCSCAVTLLR